MSEHCHSHEVTHNKRILWIVLILNFAMFGLEIWQGLAANSTALLADAADFFSDSVSYAITLYVLTKHLHIRAKASIFKAVLMLGIAVLALGQGVHNIIHAETPIYQTMGWVATLALTANVISALLLYKSREQDSNMRSIWLCSRNDAIANIMIIAAAFLVFQTGTLWPDLAVAVFIAWIESSAAIQIIRQARGELKS